MPVWINPLMLFGAFAAAVPVILHLVMRRRTRIVPFSRLIFMSDLPRRSEQHFRLKQLLLLLIRIACLVLLAMAFARPYFEKRSASVGSGTPKAMFVLVDVSGSMAFEDRLKTAVGKVADRIEALDPGDLVGLAFFDNTPRLLSELTADRAMVLSLLKSNETCTYERTDIASALQFGSDMLADVQDCKRTLLLASDFQQTGLKQLEQSWNLPTGVALELIDMGGDARNSSVADAVIVDQSAAGKDAGRSQSLRALLAHYGPSGSVDLDVTLEVNGRALDTQAVEMAAGQQRIVEFTLPSVGRVSQGCVRLERDGLQADDLRHFVIAPKRRTQVVVLVNPDGSTPNEAVFPSVALAAGDPPQCDVRFVTEAGLAHQSQRDLHLVIVPGEVDLNRRSADWLRGYAEGGGIVLLAADKKQPEIFAYRAGLADVEPVGWMECDRNAAVFQMFADYDVRHPVFAPFRDAQRGNFTAVDFSGHERTHPGPTVAVLAAFDDGSPALMERRLGKGRILLFTSSLGPKWSNLPYRGLYAAFMQNIARFAVSDRELPNSYLIGAPALLWGTPGDSVYVRGPDGQETATTFDEKGDAFFRQTLAPGIYTVSGENPSSFAVNLDPEESNLESVPAEDLSFLVGSTDEEAEARLAGMAGRKPGEELDRATAYWKYLLVALLVLALAETLLANRTYR